jgi:O-antigen/teichoic acid export membrane protein
MLGRLATETAIGRRLCLFAPKGGMGRAALTLGGATLASQVLGILLMPVYSRLYTPTDYGLLGVFSSIVLTSLTVGSLCYETGIPVAKDDSEAVGLTAIAMLIVALIAFGTAAWLGLTALMGWSGMNLQLGSYFWLVPVSIVGGGAYRAIRYWALRRKAMGAIARTSIAQLVTSNVINLGFGILYPSPLGLILSGIAGISTGVAGLARRTELTPQMRLEHSRGLSLRQLWSLARKYQRLPLIAAPSTLFNSLGLYLPTIMLAPYFGADFAGQFFMALKIISLPIALIGGSLNQVFFGSAAEVARERPHELARFFHRTFVRGAACSLGVILPVGLIAPWVVPLILGDKWRPAGEIVLWLGFYNVVGLSVSMLSSIPNIVGHLRGQFVIDVTRALAVFLLLYLGHWAGLSGMAVVKGYTVVMIVNYMACYCLYSHQVKRIARTGLTGWSGSVELR